MATSFSLRCLAAGAVSLLVAACGGGDSVEPASQTDTAAFSTLLDDDGGVMPTDPRAVPPHVEPAIRAQRHATAAQAGDLQRMPGYDVRWIEVGCCSDAAVARAVDLAVGGDAGPPYAVFVSGPDRRAAAAVVDRVIASGLDRVWRVSP